MRLSWIAELAHQMGLVPLAWLVVLTVRGRKSGPAWWWLALAFAVSWLADSAAHVVDPDLVGNLYPITQAALVGAVLLDRRDAMRLAVALVIVGVVAVVWRGPLGIDVLLRTVAWGSVTWIAWERPALGRLRDCLVVSFGLGLVAWWWYAFAPGWWSWSGFQIVRLLGLLLFCAAVSRPAPRLRLARRER